MASGGDGVTVAEPEVIVPTNNGGPSYEEGLRTTLDAYCREPALEGICEMNGITKDDFLTRRKEVTTIEVFMQNFTTMQHVTYFPNLVRLQLLHVEIKEINHLESLKSLEQLWITEGDLTTISGLEHLTNLRQLYLSGNKIQRIQGLDTLTALEVLWLQDNQIPAIEGIENLKSLKSLWLGGNHITQLQDRLTANISLEELNVAGNRISSFREILPLDALPSLERVFFSDPSYGDNPICSLCNYQTFTLFHLRRIKVLDHVHITEDQRHIAEATFIKKKIYYNMRIKTLRRNAWNLIRKAQQFKATKLSEAALSANVLVRMQKELERELGEIRTLPPDVPPSFPVPVAESKLKSVQELLAVKNGECTVLETAFEKMKRDVLRTAENIIAKLMVELHTGGNIRMEDGKAKDVWHQSCVELLRTRFFASDFDGFGIRDINVSKVTRVHNRILRNKFESALEAVVDTSDPSYKRALEYLFVVDATRNDTQLHELVEGGFEGRRSDNDGVALTNSVFLAEQQHLLDARRDGQCGGGSNQMQEATLLGRIIVAKVYLGKCTPEKTNEPPAPITTTGDGASASKSSASLYESVVHRSNKICREDYPEGISTVYRTKVGDPKQRVWFCFQPALVLPEYVVEFSFSPNNANNPVPSIAEWGDDRAEEINTVLTKLFPQKSSVDTQDLRMFAHHFLSFVQHCQSMTLSDQSCEMLSSPPIPPPRTKITNMSEASIKSVVKHVDLTALTYLNLLGNHVKRIEIPPCLSATLTTLVLAFNELPAVDGLSAVPNLEHLDLSFNLIKRVEGLESLSKLRTLHLNNNLLYRTSDVAALGHMPSITDLSVGGNAVADTKGFRGLLIASLQKLVILDGVDIVDEREQAKLIPARILVSVLVKAAITALTKAHLPLPVAPDDEATPANSEDAAPTPYQSEVLTATSEIELNSFRIRRIENLHLVRNLRILSLQDNELTKIEGLDACPLLEELNLENNRIAKLEGLEHVAASLRKLDVGKNRITRIENLENMRNLTLLSVEDNDLPSLKGLVQLSNLMELYAANNKIDSIKEVNQIRDLAKLIIIDLSGNPCCPDAQYRLYTVFALKKLKVLDGTSVDVNEVSQAKEMFAGRVSSDLLNERLDPGSKWGLVTDLSLSGCGIKDVSMMEHFTSLMHLRLDHNLLTDVGNGLKTNVALISLNLSFNRISNCVLGKSIDALENLESLSLEGNAIVSLQAHLLKLPKLKFLNLKGNELTKIDGLDNLNNLRELIVNKNKIRGFDLQALQHIPLLRELHAEDNSIKSLEGLRCLTHLYRLALTSNRVADIVELERLDGLTGCVEVSLTGNQVARKSMYRPTLISVLPACVLIDGREVAMEERERATSFFSQEGLGIPPNVFTDSRPTVVQPAMPMPVPPQQKAIKLVQLDTADPRSPGGARISRPPMTTGPVKTSQGTVGYSARTSSAEPRTGQGEGPGVQGLRPRPKASSFRGGRGAR